jgi:hypothetical protein
MKLEERFKYGELVAVCILVIVFCLVGASAVTKYADSYKQNTIDTYKAAGP